MHTELNGWWWCRAGYLDDYDADAVHANDNEVKIDVTITMKMAIKMMTEMRFNISSNDSDLDDVSDNDSEVDASNNDNIMKTKIDNKWWQQCMNCWKQFSKGVNKKPLLDLQQLTNTWYLSM